MKIAIIGSGAAGSVFAGYLKRGGAEEIWLVDPNKAHMDKVAKDGLIMVTPSGEFLVEGFKTAYSADEVGIVDIAILMVKTTITELALKGAMSCIGPNTVVATLQNGLGNDEVVKKHIPADRVLFGSGNMGTELPEPGKCVAFPSAGNNMYFGAAEKSALNDAAGLYLEKHFAAGECVPKYYDDVRPSVWKKATSNSGFNSICALLRLKIGEVHADPNGVAMVWQIWREASDVSEAMGVQGVWEHMQSEMSRVVTALGNYYPSMAQDTMAHRKTEVETLSGAISDYGKKYNVPTPTCDVVTQAIKAIEANYDKQYKDK